MTQNLLYHYTSIDTLALILKNKAICFNNLTYVDDLEESMTKDKKHFGKFFNVSCWTSSINESLQLWKFYTPNMQGIRIGLPKFPFKKYKFKAGQYGLKNDITTFINLDEVYNSNGSIVPNMPLFFDIEYTDNSEELFPKILNCRNENEYKNWIKTGELMNENMEISYALEKLGKYKRTCWSFQNECRYLINCSPMSLRELNNNPTMEMYREIARRFEDETYPAPFEKIFLEIDEDCFNKMEILIGPRVTESQKIIIRALVNQYAPNTIIKDSSLRVR